MKHLTLLLTTTLALSSTGADARFDADNAFYGAKSIDDPHLTQRKVLLEKKMQLEPDRRKQGVYQQELETLDNFLFYKFTPFKRSKAPTPTERDFENALDRTTAEWKDLYITAMKRRKTFVGKFDPNTASIPDFKRRWIYLIEKDKLRETKIAPSSAPGSIGEYALPLEDDVMESKSYQRGLEDLKNWYNEVLKNRSLYHQAMENKRKLKVVDEL